MIGFHPDCPPSMTLLADHLDSALAAGEDLMAATLPARADLDEIDGKAAPDAVDAFVRRVQQLESSLLLRVLQARRLAADIGREDPTLKATGSLFRAQTETLHELILRSGRNGDGGLARIGDNYAYLRSRGLIAPEAAAPSPYESLTVGETFRVGGVAGLSQILDMVSAVLDLLDARFGLYVPEPIESDGRDSVAADDLALQIAQVQESQCEETGKAQDSPALADEEPLAGGAANLVEAVASDNPRSTKHQGSDVDGVDLIPPEDPPDDEARHAGEAQPSAGPRTLASMVADIGTVP
jgi:hypothetical protein